MCSRCGKPVYELATYDWSFNKDKITTCLTCERCAKCKKLFRFDNGPLWDNAPPICRDCYQCPICKKHRIHEHKPIEYRDCHTYKVSKKCYNIWASRENLYTLCMSLKRIDKVLPRDIRQYLYQWLLVTSLERCHICNSVQNTFKYPVCAGCNRWDCLCMCVFHWDRCRKQGCGSKCMRYEYQPSGYSYPSNLSNYWSNFNMPGFGILPNPFYPGICMNHSDWKETFIHHELPRIDSSQLKILDGKWICHDVCFAKIDHAYLRKSLTTSDCPIWNSVSEPGMNRCIRAFVQDATEKRLEKEEEKQRLKLMHIQTENANRKSRQLKYKAMPRLQYTPVQPHKNRPRRKNRKKKY